MAAKLSMLFYLYPRSCPMSDNAHDFRAMQMAERARRLAA